MSEEDPKAPSGAIPPIKRRVIKSAQTAPEGGAASDGATPAPASSDAAPAPAPLPKAPVPSAEPLPAVRVESRPDGRRLMDARAPRRPYEDRRRPPPDRQAQSEQARAAEMGMPRRPDRTRQALDDRPRTPRMDAPPRDDRDVKKTVPDGWRRAQQADGRSNGEAKQSEPTRARADAGKPIEKRRPEPKPVVESAPPPPPAKESDSNAEIALAGAPPVRIKQAAPKKDKPKTGKEALAQKARDPKHGRKKGGPTSGAVRGEAAAAKAKAREEEAEAEETTEDDSEAELEIPKRPSLWQRVVSIFRRSK